MLNIQTTALSLGETVFIGQVIRLIGAQNARHLHYYSSRRSRKTICTPTAHCCPRKPHFQRGSLPAGSNPACYYPSPSRIETKPAATRSPDYHVHRLPSLLQEVHGSGANVTLYSSPLRIDSGYFRHRVVKINAGEWEDLVPSFEERLRRCHFAGDGQRKTEANTTAEPKKNQLFKQCEQQGPPQRWAHAGGGCMF